MLTKLLCLLGWCRRCVTDSNDHEIWGECIDCGRRHGVVTRQEMRAYIEREEAKRRRHALERHSSMHSGV